MLLVGGCELQSDMQVAPRWPYAVRYGPPLERPLTISVRLKVAKPYGKARPFPCGAGGTMICRAVGSLSSCGSALP